MFLDMCRSANPRRPHLTHITCSVVANGQTRVLYSSTRQRRQASSCVGEAEATIARGTGRKERQLRYAFQDSLEGEAPRSPFFERERVDGPCRGRKCMGFDSVSDRCEESLAFPGLDFHRFEHKVAAVAVVAAWYGYI